jgi:ABC-type amino acid transport system permease subunit
MLPASLGKRTEENGSVAASENVSKSGVLARTPVCVIPALCYPLPIFLIKSFYVYFLFITELQNSIVWHTLELYAQTFRNTPLLVNVLYVVLLVRFDCLSVRDRHLQHYPSGRGQ